MLTTFICLLTWVAAVQVMAPAQVSGRVIDIEDGRAVAGIGVELLRSRFDVEGILRFEIVGAASTNDEGEYEIANILPGGQYFLATSEYGRSRFYRRSFYPAAPYPAAAYLAAPGSAAAIFLSPGQEVANLNFTVVPARLVTVRGRVRDALNVRQPHRSSVTVVRQGTDLSSVLGTTLVNRNDTFEISGVPPGAYYLIGKRIDDEANRSESIVPIEVGDFDVNDVEMVAAEGHYIRGRVTGGPKNVVGLRVALRPLNGLSDIPGARSSPRPDNGGFAFFGVPSGEYRLSITGAPRGYHVHSARLGQTDLLRRTAFLRGVVADEIEIVLSEDGGRINGTVSDVDGNPIGGSVVTLVPVDRLLIRPDLHKTTTSDRNGQFVIDAIAPGVYELYAWNRFEPNSYYDDAFMRRFIDRAVTIRIDRGGSAAIALTQIELEIP